MAKEVKCSSYIYLIQEREFVNANQNVYKLGKTKQKNTKRASQYPKGSHLVLQKICDDCDQAEKSLITIFKNKFKQREDIGNEYFEGEQKDMIKEIDLFISGFVPVQQKTNIYPLLLDSPRVTFNRSNDEESNPNEDKLNNYIKELYENKLDIIEINECLDFCETWIKTLEKPEFWTVSKEKIDNKKKYLRLAKAVEIECYSRIFKAKAKKNKRKE